MCRSSLHVQSESIPSGEAEGLKSEQPRSSAHVNISKILCLVRLCACSLVQLTLFIL